ncbi:MULTISPECIES: hypothetical protein [Aeromonas]|uniref:hypothetical protein n=1 Tax=Aeromonas TaxID=642 RepID=UPI002B060098|nr:hypothetical protein [Aeromonas jandaei]
MQEHDTKKIGVYQMGAVVIGLVLLVLGILTMVRGVGYGLAITIGSLGWSALGLMMSPQVRNDLWGTRFEKTMPAPEEDSN